jgi:ferredoxin, 2Fe-2S
MPNITFISPEGESKSFNVDSGQSLMQVANSIGIKGIVAECGGSAMCATCHVYIDPYWISKIPAADSNELEMLECTASERKPESRLSCQIRITDQLDGLILKLPDAQ